MYLKALKLHGFKSFADPSTLRFEPGVTAVVGPNGCGKSNIADAIRWVLGEQSAKALRGGKMQDVIFEGADTRKPAQLCEVSLLLTDCERQLGSEFHEIEIMRRVHRDGQSEYFFNGQPCRLKDIHKLFMDTGIGRTSYSIMAQGQIDQILSSKPEDRRAVFEEAAGITKYKAQRREALQKLTLTEQNLARVSDVITEVGRQIGSLRRQASKALRYKRLGFRLRHLSLAYSSFHYNQAAATLAGLEEQVIRLRASAETRRTHFDQQQAGLEDLKQRRSRLNQRAQDAQQAVFDLRSEKEQAENAINLSRIKGQALGERIDSSRANLGELEMNLQELAEQVDSGSQDKQQQLNLLGSSDAVFQNRNREVAVAEGELSKLEQELHQAKFQLLTLESSVARLRTDSLGYEVDQKTSLAKHDTLLQEIEAVRLQQSSAAARVSEIEMQVEEALAAKARAHAESQEAQQSITDLTREFRDAQRKLQEIDRQLAQRSARLKLLQQLHEKWEGFGEGAKALLQGRFDSVLEGARPVALSHNLEISAEYGKAVEGLLGNAVEAITVADVGVAQRILRQLEADPVGSVCLQVAELAGGASASADALPAGLVPALVACSGLPETHPAARLLAACYIADDLCGFLEFWKANPAFSFLAVATRRGEVVDRRGLVFGGQVKKGGNSIVQREIDLRETARQLADDQKAHDDQKAAIDSLSARLAESESLLETRREEVLQTTQQVASMQAEQRNAVRSLEEVDTRLRRMEADVQSVDNARRDAHTRWERAQAQLTEAETAVTQGRERIHKLDTRIMEVRTDRDVKRDSLGQARLELAERRQRVEVLDRGLADMERRRAQIQELLIQRQQEIETWTEQVASLDQEAASARSRTSQIAESLVVAQQQVEQVRSELLEVERQIGSVESNQFALREEAEVAHAEFSRCEVKLAESRARADFLREDVHREFQVDIATQNWKHLLWHADDEPEGVKPLDLDDEEESETAEAAPAPREQAPVADEAAAADAASPGVAAAAAEVPPAKRRRTKKQKGEPSEADLTALDQTSWEQVKTEIEALRTRIAGMGAVNLVAIEEYAELKQRYDFLKTQCDDLTQSKAELLKAIDEINQTSQQQFAITFEQIKKNFEQTFTTLFGGGHANLELIQNGEDPLESGIEITAQPPGTKLKGITLLSGGQKTLTAVGLLFALYMVKPSPFCLLDELDAPLDESNIGRFTDLLKRFVKESQFIIITHNKRTVAAANAIYGVTMEERGVSKTVSMRFNHDHGEAEAEPRNIAEAVRGAKSG
jgi:chromosome segregation protein